nr:MAG TPA: hypothetical protein [Caudoviricetes sp.]
MDLIGLHYVHGKTEKKFLVFRLILKMFLCIHLMIIFQLIQEKSS